MTDDDDVELNKEDDLKELDELISDPPHFLFELSVNNEVRGRVFGPKDKRNWVLWRVSRYAIAFEDEGIVAVKRYINSKWERADGWRNLAH